MIEMKAGDLLGAKEILNRLANTQMSAKDCFKVTRILKIIDNEYNNIMDTQKKVLEKYAEKDQHGNYKTNDKGGVMLKKESSDECIAQMNELYSTVISLNCDKFNASLLENLSFTPSQLMTIDGLIDYGD